MAKASRPERRQDLSLAHLAEDLRELPVNVNLTLPTRIDQLFDTLRRTPPGGSRAEVLSRLKHPGSKAAYSLREQLEELDPVVSYDLVAGAAQLLLDPPRSLALGEEARVLLGSFFDEASGETLVLIMRFVATGGENARLDSLDEFALEEQGGSDLHKAVSELAQEVSRVQGLDKTLLPSSDCRGTLVLTPSVLATFENPEETKHKLKGLAAVENVDLRIRLLESVSQNALRMLGRQIASEGNAAVVVWKQPFERVPPFFDVTRVVLVEPLDQSPEGFVTSMRDVVSQVADREAASAAGHPMPEPELSVAREQLDHREMRILVVSGNQENQGSMCETIHGELGDINLSVSIEWMTGWGGGGSLGALGQYEGIVWSELVSHQRGEALRREAGEAGVPVTKVVGHGHGRGALRAAILEALRLGLNRRAGA